jgi:hypothetical protein
MLPPASAAPTVDEGRAALLDDRLVRLLLPYPTAAQAATVATALGVKARQVNAATTRYLGW